MIPPKFEYAAPTTVDEAVAALGEAGEDAKVIAGGQSLLPVLRLRLRGRGHPRARRQPVRRRDRRLFSIFAASRASCTCLPTTPSAPTIAFHAG